MDCKHEATKCIDSRMRRVGKEAYRTRRYKCLDCGIRYSTVEVPVKVKSKVPAINVLREDYGISDKQRAAIAQLIEVFTEYEGEQ